MPNLPGGPVKSYHMSLIAAKIIVFFFGYEVLMGELRGDYRNVALAFVSVLAISKPEGLPFLLVRPVHIHQGINERNKSLKRQKKQSPAIARWLRCRRCFHKETISSGCRYPRRFFEAKCRPAHNTCRYNFLCVHTGHWRALHLGRRPVCDSESYATIPRKAWAAYG